MPTEEDNTPIAPSEEIPSTPENPTQPTPQPQPEHVEQKPVAEEDPDQLTPEEVKRLKSKVSKLEKENNQLKKPAQTSKVLSDQEAEVLNTQFRGNPSLYETWRKDYVKQGGHDYGSYEQVYGTAPTTNNTSYQPKGQTQPNIYEAIENYTVMKNFLGKHPEYDTRLAKDDDDAANRHVDLQLVTDTAAKLQARARVRGEKITEEDAFETALLIFNPKQALDDATDNGRLIAKQEAMIKGSGATSGLSSGAGKSDTDVALDDNDRAVMKALGLQEDAMKAQKRR